LFDKNLKLKEDFENLKNENYLLSLELSQLKEFVPEVSSFDIKSVPLQSFKSEINELKNHVSFLEIENKELVGELHQMRNEKKLLPIPNWIKNPQTKRTEGLGFNHKKKFEKPKKRVDLPSDKVCMFCGNTGHFRNSCPKRLGRINENLETSKVIWKKKSIVPEGKEPKKDWVPNSNN